MITSQTTLAALLIFTVCVLMPVNISLGQSSPASGDDLVQPHLLADVTAIEPGSTFTLAIHLQITPGWHIYWQNPGDSGLPTKVSLNLPAGLHLIDLHWPTPHRWVQPGDIVGYGYENEVVLLATIQADPDLATAAGQPLTLSADVSWLVCMDICLPGKASIDLQLPVGPPNASPDSSLIDLWRSTIPVTPDQSGVVQAIDITGVAGQPMTIKLTWSQDVQAIDWFPASTPNLDMGEVRITNEGRTTLIQFTPTLLAGTTLDHDVLDSVLSWKPTATNTTQVRGIEIQIPLR